MSAPVRAAFYARTSTERQDLERQVGELEALAARSGWLTVEIVRETASGADPDRPGLAHVLELVHARAVDILAVTELSRLTRGGITELLELVRELDQAGVQLNSIAEPWAQSATPVRDLILAFGAWVAAEERRLLVERTRSGLARARARGRRGGRPVVLTEAKLLEARRLLARGMRPREIAQRVGIKRATLERRLRAERGAAKPDRGVNPPPSSSGGPAAETPVSPGGSK